jgi:hypothetical protein
MVCNCARPVVFAAVVMVMMTSVMVVMAVVAFMVLGSDFLATDNALQWGGVLVFDDRANRDHPDGHDEAAAAATVCSSE